jgi:hypothetical protein
MNTILFPFPLPYTVLSDNFNYNLSIISKIVAMQQKAIKIISRSNINADTTPILKILQILPF